MYDDDYRTTRYGYVYGGSIYDAEEGPLHTASYGVDPTVRKIALARLEGEVLDWSQDHGDTFPALRDLIHQMETQIHLEREDL